MKVIWQPEADNGRQQIAYYIRQRFDKNTMVAFMQEVRKTTRLLCQFPEMGRVDPLFEDRAYTYRSIIIHKLSKLVYRIDGSIINIVAFWDCRRESNNQAAKVKE